MRTLLLGLVCTGGLLAGTAQAASNDILELNLGVRYLLSSGYFAADNEDVNYATDVFKLVGDQAMGFGLGAALGHRFDSRQGPWEVLVKYNFSTTPEDEGIRTYPMGNVNVTTNLKGQLDQHDVLLTARFPGNFMPIPVLNHEILYYDLGMGVTTLSYEYGVTDLTAERTRSGLAFNVGMGCRIPLSETWTFRAGADLIFSKLQDIEDGSGALISEAPSASGLRLQAALVHYFESRF
jgi:hypothetical protein